MPVPPPRSLSPLRLARQARGWSQRQVAEAVGTNRFTVTRWEQGLAFPSPHFRQQLTLLFGLTPESLGLVPPAAPLASPDLAPQSDPLTTTPPVAVYDPLLPPPLPSSAGLIGREELRQQLKARLLAGGTLVLSALQGLPGVGKTALALALAHDPEVAAHFADGVLWVGLGQTPQVLETLARWGALLGLAATGGTRLSTPAAWAQALRTAIGPRRFLFVLDDAWSLEPVLACQVGGAGCAALVTTRRPDLALQVAGGEMAVVPELEPEDGLSLLARLAPQAVETEPEAARTLVEAMGGLPLGLVLLGKHLQRESYSGQPRRIRAAMARLQHSTGRLHLTQPQAPVEAHPSLPAGTPLSLQASIGLSIAALRAEAQTMLAALALFPPKPNSFSEEAALAVSAGTPETLDALVDAGLVESQAPERYTIHQTIADYVHNTSVPHAAVQRLAAYYLAFTRGVRGDDEYVRLESETTNLLATLDLAHHLHLTDDVVQLTQHVALFLMNRGHYHEAQDYLTRCRGLIEEQASHPDHISILLLSGIASKEVGRLADALVLAQHAETLAQSYSMAEMHAAALKLQGQLHLRFGHVDHAEQVFHQAKQLIHNLPISHPINRELETAIFSGLAQCAGRRGAYTQAEAIAREGLAFTRRTRRTRSECIFLASLGMFAGLQGNYEQAYHLYAQELDQARQHRFVDVMMESLANLAFIAIEQGRWETAQQLAEESVSLARKTGNHERVGLGLSDLAAALIEQEQYDMADQYLQEGLMLAEQMGNVQCKAFLLLYQARSARLRQKTNTDQILQEGKRLAQQAQVASIVLDFDLELGEWCLACSEWETAFTHFEEAQKAAERSESRVRRGQALFGKARTIWALGAHEAASRFAEESLEILRQSQSRYAREVEHWQETHRAPEDVPVSAAAPAEDLE
ncbi:MAG TPA: tetratricopeptide repeat protein [Ktedonobacterales bacterium]|nr:tetratricopeptide repeat protein [Ktedonobacterales bacterium]